MFRNSNLKVEFSNSPDYREIHCEVSWKKLDENLKSILHFRFNEDIDDWSGNVVLCEMSMC